ncbi:MAG: ATP-dependent DNA helicase [Candidatus Nanopelagicales bacterium]
MATTDRLLAAVVADLEGSDRPGQQEMVDLVRDALAGHDTVLIQAGTGTGKSVGYLVPAVQHVAAEPRGQRRVVVATATLALQHQLVERDLPRLVAAVSEELPRPVSFATLKGRSNYLCLARTAGTEDADQQTLDRTTLEKQAERVVQWSASTTTGDRDELEDVSGLVWSAYSVNAQECARGSGCAFVEDCWAEKAIATARAADVVVTNHSLLALNAVQEGILGEHDAVIVDEAHSLPSALQRAATSELSVDAISRAARRSRSAGAAEESSRLLDAADAFEMALAGWDAPEGRRLAQLPAPVTQALITVREACDVTRGVLRRATESDAAGRQRAMATVDEVHTAAGELLSVDETRVMWRRRDRLVVLPLDVSGVVRDGIIGERAAVFTSATLQLGGSFDAVAVQLGLRTGEWVGQDVGSPFHYSSQGILFVPDRLPAPGPGWPTEEALDTCARLVEAAGGRALVLMASWNGVAAVADALDDVVPGELLVQRKGEPTAGLIRAFAQDPTSVLVGTLGLWQGVDVPGAACTLVIIDKLPFPPPTDPVVSARQAAIDSRGGSGWMQVSLPQAAVTLAQGAGRLIRTDDDRGVVAILDSRLANRRYGGYLRRSLPPFAFMTDEAKVRQALQRLNEKLGE